VDVCSPTCRCIDNLRVVTWPQWSYAPPRGFDYESVPAVSQPIVECLGTAAIVSEGDHDADLAKLLGMSVE
jgi:hypothetical protein